jgi:hypothetical protein
MCLVQQQQQQQQTAQPLQRQLQQLRLLLLLPQPPRPMLLLLVLLQKLPTAQQRRDLQLHSRQVQQTPLLDPSHGKLGSQLTKQ